MTNYTTDAQLDAQGLKHEEWLEDSMRAQRHMFNTARAKHTKQCVSMKIG